MPVQQVTDFTGGRSAQPHEVRSADTAPSGRLSFVLFSAEAGVAVHFQPAIGVHVPVGELLWVALCPTDYGVQPADVENLGLLGVPLQGDDIDGQSGRACSM